jgi:YidC/Oxa1 family membrane protein insertase
MERRVLLALALSLLVLLVWPRIFPPPVPPSAPALPHEAAEGPGAAAAEDDVPEPEPGAYEARAAQAVEIVEHEDDLFRVRLSNEGGRILSWRLKEYEGQDGEPLEVVARYRDAGEAFPLAVRVGDPALAQRINRALFEIEETEVPSGRRISFHWADGSGLSVQKSLTFRSGNYLVQLDLEVVDRGRTLPASVVWGPGFGAQDPQAAASTYYYHGQVVWNRGGAVTRWRAHKVEPATVAGALRWAGLEDQYFAALVLPGNEPATAALEVARLAPERGAEGAAEPEPAGTVGVSITADGGLLYVGPKKYTMLLGLGHELDRVVWFATNGFLAAVSKFLFLCLLWVHGHTVANYGLAIVLTTVILRVLLFPLNQYSMVSIKKSQLQMQRLQPKVNAIRNRYKKHKDAENRRKMNEELMAMYKREGVNPMGGLTGCLPILAQFPILIGFYNMLTVAVELRGAPFFGWIRDLSQRDPYWVTPVLMGATMLLQQKMAVTKVTDPVQRQQQMIMMLMPFFFTYICLQMPSGLVLYWFVNNVLGIGQQWLVNRRASRLEAAAENV